MVIYDLFIKLYLSFYFNYLLIYLLIRSVSFVFVASGFGLIGLSFFYVLIDIYKIYFGAPFIYMGMNSILIYVGHETFEEFFPFSFLIPLTNQNHVNLLIENIIGVICWMIIAYYFYKIKFFVKI
jgi:heparan-alpha-glucosaminide N-acetyltransferase